MRIIQKYGGTSLADGEKLRSAAARAAAAKKGGNQVLVVVSAQGHTTDALEARGAQLQGSKREMDALLAAGEQISAALMAMTLQDMGCPAVSLTGWQAGIRTDAQYGNARILSLDADRIFREWDKGHIVVVAGFQGVDSAGNITTLGRGGSDTTAVALAGLLKADVCRIYTDVDGVYDRDPSQYPDAVKFRRIGYEEMLRLVHQGAQVLHDRSVELAQRYGITLEVRSAFTDAPGTMVGP